MPFFIWKKPKQKDEGAFSEGLESIYNQINNTSKLENYMKQMDLLKQLCAGGSKDIVNNKKLLDEVLKKMREGLKLMQGHSFDAAGMEKIIKYEKSISSLEELTKKLTQTAKKPL